MGYNLSSSDFKKTICIRCGIELPCRHITETARCPDCIYHDYHEQMKEDKKKVKAELWGY